MSGRPKLRRVQWDRWEGIAVRLIAFMLLFGVSAHAQVIRPGDTRLSLPPLLPPAGESSGQLPAINVPEPSDEDGLYSGVRFQLEKVDVRGNQALDDNELEEIVQPYLDREVSFADLQALRDALTQAYVDAGYMTSGAVLPAQSIEDGVVEILIVEGEVAEIEIETNGRLRKAYLEPRIANRIGGAANVLDIEETLRLLQQDRRIDRIDAQLVPGARRGESILKLRVIENEPYEVTVDINNHQPPALGAEGGALGLGYTNLSGYGDAIFIGYQGTEGLQNVDVSYSVPVTSNDLVLEVHASGAWSEIVAEPFDILDIENQTYTAGFTAVQPIYRTLQTELALTLTTEYRYNKSFLFSNGFRFTPGPDEDGESKLAVLRFGQEFFWRGTSQAFSARSQFTVGVDALGATNNSGSEPDGQFFSWLGQLQWAGLYTDLGIQVIARADLQLTDSALLGLEQFGMGGHSTVRGYHENEQVRDQGVVGALEVRVPVWWKSTGEPVVELAPFIDVGHSWNKRKRGSEAGTGDNEETLLGMGLGARWAITNWSSFQLYWGKNLLSRNDTEEWNLQDTSLYFRLRAEWP